MFVVQAVDQREPQTWLFKDAQIEASVCGNTAAPPRCVWEHWEQHWEASV